MATSILSCSILLCSTQSVRIVPQSPAPTYQRAAWLHWSSKGKKKKEIKSLLCNLCCFACCSVALSVFSPLAPSFLWVFFSVEVSRLRATLGQVARLLGTAIRNGLDNQTPPGLSPSSLPSLTKLQAWEPKHQDSVMQQVFQVLTWQSPLSCWHEEFRTQLESWQPLPAACFSNHFHLRCWSSRTHGVSWRYRLRWWCRRAASSSLDVCFCRSRLSDYLCPPLLCRHFTFCTS